MRPAMKDTHSREWLAEEAVRRWVLRSRAIIENIASTHTDNELAAFLRDKGCSGWPWNDGKTHLQLIQDEFRQLSWMHDDRWRVIRLPPRSPGGGR